MSKRIDVIIGLVSLFLVVKAQNVTIYGTALTYKNKTITAYKYTDFITNQKKELTSCKVDSNGNFEFKFSVNAVQLVFLDLETTLGFIYVEPNKTYHVLLPAYQPISLQQQLSPYFQPAAYRLYILNADTTSLNFTIAKIDYFYQKILQLIANHAINRDTIAKKIDWLHTIAPDSGFVGDYLNSTIELLKVQLFYYNKKKIAINFLKHNKLQWNNPAYFKFFNYVFSNCFKGNFFNFYDIAKSISNQDFNKLTQIISFSLDTINQNTSQLIALKGLHDLFYSVKDLDVDIIGTIKNSFNYIQDSNITEIANNIYHKLTTMRIGYPPPNFKLRNHLGFKRSLRAFRGKFVYLNFCHPKLLACQQQLPILAKYYESAPKDFEIITIIYGLTYKEFKKFVRSHKNYKWKFLYGGDDKHLLQKYNVCAFPTYYLIDPDGNLVANPAPSPEEDFKQVFTAQYKKWYQKNANAPRIR